MNFDFRLTLNTTFYNLPPNTFSYVYVQWAIPYDIYDIGIHSFIIITDIIVYTTRKHEEKSNFQIFPFHFDISICQVYISQFKLNISQFQLYMYQFQFTFFTSKLTFLSSKVDIYQFELDISLYQVQVTYSSNYCVVERCCFSPVLYFFPDFLHLNILCIPGIVNLWLWITSNFRINWNKCVSVHLLDLLLYYHNWKSVFDNLY